MLPEAAGRGAAGHVAARQRRREQKQQILRMEFKAFVANLIRLPCQIIKSGRRLIYRLLNYNPWQEVLLSAPGQLRIQLVTHPGSRSGRLTRALALHG